MHLFETFMGVEISHLVVIAAAILVVLSVGVLAAAMGRFRRAQSILD